jgi:hypothetical protein
MKRKFNLNTLLLLAALPLGALAAAPAAPTGNMQADPPAATTKKMDPAPLFTGLDSNHDGFVTTDEAKRSADVTARFATLDANHDGKISAAEYTKGMKNTN